MSFPAVTNTHLDRGPLHRSRRWAKGVYPDTVMPCCDVVAEGWSSENLPRINVEGGDMTIPSHDHMSSDRLTEEYLVVLCSILENPFADGVELAKISGGVTRTIYRYLKRLTIMGLVASINRGTAVLPASRRHYPTRRGIALAARSLGIQQSELIRRYPVSRQWLEVLLRRIDTVATTYRLASTLAGEAARPSTVAFRRSGAYDAILTLGDERTVGLVRQGLVGPRGSIQWRLRSLNRQYPGTGPANAIVLSPTWWDANVNRSYVSSNQGPQTHVLVESEELLNGLDAESQKCLSAGFNPECSTAENLVKRGLSDRRLPVRASPRRKRSTIPDPERMVASHPGIRLSRSELRAFYFVSHWAGISRKDLMASRGIRPSRMSRLMGPLVRRDGLVHSFGRSPDLHYAPADIGIRYWAYGDRTDVDTALAKWKMEGESPKDRPGTLISKLHGPERKHTEALYWIVSNLYQEARASDDATLEWVLPTHRVARNFSDPEGQTSVRPDALGALVLEEDYLPFMLEYERTAFYPGEVTDRLSRYRRYFMTGRPSQDHGRSPCVLFVFPDARHEDKFVEVASSEGDPLPILTSNLDTMRRDGVLSDVWRGVDNPQEATRVALRNLGQRSSN